MRDFVCTYSDFGIGDWLCVGKEFCVKGLKIDEAAE
jgi:hypothetical protein